MNGYAHDGNPVCAAPAPIRVGDGEQREHNVRPRHGRHAHAAGRLPRSRARPQSGHADRHPIRRERAHRAPPLPSPSPPPLPLLTPAPLHCIAPTPRASSARCAGLLATANLLRSSFLH